MCFWTWWTWREDPVKEAGHEQVTEGRTSLASSVEENSMKREVVMPYSQQPFKIQIIK